MECRHSPVNDIGSGGGGGGRVQVDLEFSGPGLGLYIVTYQPYDQHHNMSTLIHVNNFHIAHL